MEVDLVTRGIPEEDTFEVDDNNNTNIVSFPLLFLYHSIFIMLEG